MKDLISKILASVKRFRKRLQPTRESVKESIKVCHFLQEMDVPHHIQRNVEVIEPEVKGTVLYALLDQTSIEQAAEAVSSKNGDTIRYHLNKLSLNDIEQVCKEQLLNCLAVMEQQDTLPDKLHLAVDTTYVLYYGKTRGPFVHHKKSKYYYRYLTITIVNTGFHVLPVIVKPVSTFDALEDLVDQAPTDLRAVTTREVEKLFADRWFYTVEVVNVLKKHSIPFVIGGKQTAKAKRILETCPKDGSITSLPYTMKSGTGQTTQVMFHAYWNTSRDQWFLAISWGITSPDEILDYKYRWGIETSYRLHKSLFLSTTTTNSALRLLYFYLSAILLACYVCLRLGIFPPCLPSHDTLLVLVQSESSLTLYVFRVRLRLLIHQGGGTKALIRKY